MENFSDPSPFFVESKLIHFHASHPSMCAHSYLERPCRTQGTGSYGSPEYDRQLSQEVSQEIDRFPGNSRGRFRSRGPWSLPVQLELPPLLLGSISYRITWCGMGIFNDTFHRIRLLSNFAGCAVYSTFSTSCPTGQKNSFESGYKLNIPNPTL